MCLLLFQKSFKYHMIFYKCSKVIEIPNNYFGEEKLALLIRFYWWSLLWYMLFSKWLQEAHKFPQQSWGHNNTIWNTPSFNWKQKIHFQCENQLRIQFLKFPYSLIMYSYFALETPPNKFNFCLFLTSPQILSSCLSTVQMYNSFSQK